MSIDPRKAIPVIGMISSGKSTFLNSLLGTDVLEAKDDITTKFICIIRHNPDLKDPLFYHLKLSHNLKSDDYDYIKDGDETIGTDEIKKKISKINSDQLSLKANYENLFYMLELKITNINNIEFLKKYDFYDIPGLNENITEKNEKLSMIKEENPKDENSLNKKLHKNIMEQEMKIINKLFPYLKKKIDFGIIVIDTENYFYPTNINIIKNIYNVFSKQIVNYLFILNKIDKSENPDETIRGCYSFFTNNIDSFIFRITDNVFFPLNSLQFKNEMLMKVNYENYYLYFFNEYCKELCQNKELQFSDFIYAKITKDKNNQDDKYQKIASLAENIDDSQFEKIKEIYEVNKKKTNKNIKFGFDFDDDEDSKNILKALYKSFLDKSLIPPYSETVKNILSFFNDFNLKYIKQKENEIKKVDNDSFSKNSKERDILINNFIEVFGQLKKYTYGVHDPNIINSLEKDLKELKLIVSNQRKIYIPLIGATSAGKSTILNDIVGYKIFPESKEECTTRGIIVQHSFDGTSKLYEITIDSSLQNKDYFIFKEKKTNIGPIIGKEEIIKFLESVNAEYAYNETNQFYILKTPIEFFNEYNVGDDLKRRIFFIDLPGSNSTQKVFGKEKFLKICTSFLFVNKDSPLNTNENSQILNSTFYSIRKDSKLKDKNIFLKNCSFVLNMFSILNENEKNIEKVKDGISEILFRKKDASYINACYFNAQQYSEYLQYKNYYNNINVVLQNLKDGYNNQFCNLFFGYIKKETNFPNYCLKTLKKELENLSLKYDPNFKCGDEFNNDIKSKIKSIMLELSQPLKANDSKTIVKISNILEYIKKNIRESSFYINSESEFFFNQIIKQIYNSDAYIEEEFNEYLKSTMDNFDSFFKIPPNKRNECAQKEFLDLSKIIDSDLKELFKSCQCEGYFSSTKNDIENFLNDKIINSSQLLSENNDDVKESLMAILNEIKNKYISQLSSKIKNKMHYLHISFSLIKNKANKKGEEINSKYNIENSSFIDDLRGINIPSFINKYYGIKYFLDVNSQEFIDNIIEVNGFWASLINFFYLLFFKNETILKDYLSELKTKIIVKFITETKSFNWNYEKMKKDIFSKISNAMGIQSSNLNKISTEDFEQTKNLFLETKKKYLLIEMKELRRKLKIKLKRKMKKNKIFKKYIII